MSETKHIIVRVFVRGENGKLSAKQRVMSEVIFKEFTEMLDVMKKKLSFDKRFVVIDNQKVIHLEKVI